MLRLQSLLLFLLCLFQTGNSYAQHKTDTIPLKPVDIISTRTASFATGTMVMVLDSSLLSRCKDDNLSSLLKNHSHITIKDYGAGGIATASCRGTAATQTGILWNGFLINSPNLALCDLSLIPAGIADQVSVHYGGSSAVNGNAALGGLVSLDYKPGYKKYTQIQLSGSYGDPGNYYGGCSFNTGNKKLDSRSRIFYTYNNNKFLFINRARKGFPLEVESHARVIHYGFLQQLGYKIKPGHELEAGIWYQITGRQQPPPMTSISSEACLGDSIFRSYLSYQITRGKAAYTLKGAYFDETERYDDNHSSIHSSYKVKSYKCDANGKFNLTPDVDMDFGAAVHFFSASITEYKNKITDKRLSLYTGMNYQPVPVLKFRINLRQEIVSGNNSPLVPSAGMEYTLFKGIIILKASAGKHYNLPSLNDKYWQPGGNLYLNPEQAWSGDASLLLSPDKKRNLKLSITVYEMRIINWIQWYPADNSGIYKASNLKKVRARGLETSLDYMLRIQKATFRFKGCFAYTRSTNESLEITNGETLEGKQLMYVPFYNGNAEAELHVKGFTFSYLFSYTGLRYIQSDNKQSLPAYQLSGLYLGKNFNCKGQLMHVYFKTNNLWNREYQVMPWHAMPLRMLSTGFNLQLNPIKNKNNNH